MEGKKTIIYLRVTENDEVSGFHEIDLGLLEIMRWETDRLKLWFNEGQQIDFNFNNICYSVMEFIDIR